jgi:hypothetical protein
VDGKDSGSSSIGLFREYLEEGGNNGELHILYSSPKIIRASKSKRMICNTHRNIEKCVQNFNMKK